MKSGDWPGGGGGKEVGGFLGFFLAGVSFGRIHVAEVNAHLTTGYYGILLVQSDWRMRYRILRVPYTVFTWAA